MNNLHRELAPISDAAWAQIEEEARVLLGRDFVADDGTPVPAGPSYLQMLVRISAHGVSRLWVKVKSAETPGYSCRPTIPRR